MLVVMALVAVVVVGIAAFAHVLGSERSANAHKWIVIVPLLIVGGWLLEQLIAG